MDLAVRVENDAEQCRPHLLGGPALGDELEDFPLPRGELMSWVSDCESPSR